jgi:phosphatidylserine decarboxylase
MLGARERPEWSLHQYVSRHDQRVVTERLLGDWAINFLYARARERAGTLFDALTSRYATKMLAFINFDLPLAPRLIGHRRFLTSCGVDLEEAVEPPESFDTPRKIFERRIRYWQCRPLPEDPRAVVSPADARVLIGSFRSACPLFIKDKFFDSEELLGRNKRAWLEAFRDGDFTICRLTPDRYHYNHVPASGEVVDFYEIPGRYHACNPGAVVQLVTPYSKNKRVVTILNTDVAGGAGVGLIAMVEIVALMIGDVVQCYSEEQYDDPRPIRTGMFLQQGAPKSCYRPGSSTDVLIFQRGRVRFADDLITNLSHGAVLSRFSTGFGQPLAETDVTVRSLIARRLAEGGGR